MSRRGPRGRDPGQPPRAPFDPIDELSCYYETRGEPNNVHLEVLVPGTVDYLILRQALAGALAAAPRARGRMAPGRAFRCRYTWEFPPVHDVDPLSHATWSDEGELAVVRDRFLASSPPLRTSPPVRLLLASGPGASCVILNAHHAAMDGMSNLELLRDIAGRYRAIAGDLASPGTALPPVPGPPVPGSAGQEQPPSVSVSPPARLSTVAPGPLPSSTLPSSSTEPLAGAAPPGIWPRARVAAVRRYPAARIAPDRKRPRQRDGYGVRLLAVASIPRVPGATVNDTLIAALIATISRWNAAHRRRPRAISITVPVNVRGQGAQGVAGNYSRTATVTADPRTAAGDLHLLLAAVTGQTSLIRRARSERASAGPQGRTPGWCPVALKRLAFRFALRAVGRIVCDTSMLSNLGNVADPPWSGYRGSVRMAFTAPVHMPRGVSVGVLTADGQLQLSFRYRHALFDAAAAARFTASYAAALAELTSSATLAGPVPAGTVPAGTGPAGTALASPVPSRPVPPSPVPAGTVSGRYRRAEAKVEEIPVVIHEALLKLLVCPVDKGSLMYFPDENLLYNPRLRRAYRITNGVPVMLAECAEPVPEREHERLIGRARPARRR